MNTNMTGFKLFSKDSDVCLCALDESRLSIGRVKYELTNYFLESSWLAYDLQVSF